MALKSLTTAEVRAIYEAEKARKDVPENYDPLKATRVLVHVELQARNPPPCSDLTPEMWAARNRRTQLTHVEKDEQIAHQKSQVTPEHRRAFAEAKDAKSLDIMWGDGTPQVLDAHHYAQKMHGMDLWKETDRLLKGASL